MHHQIIHEQMRRSGVSLNFEPNPCKRVAMALRSIAVYHHAEADALVRMADLLEQAGDSET
jgi:hypothetical protein